MAKFTLICVTERWENNVYYNQDTNSVFIENVSIVTTTDGYVGSTNNKGRFVF